MSRVSTNNVSLRYVIETSLGVAPTSGWENLEPNSVGAYGAQIATQARRPISTKRGRRKGAVTDLTSAVDFEGDLTMDAHEDFIEGFVFAEATNIEFNLRSSSSPPPVATSTTFTIDAASALLAGKVQWATGAQATLVYATGYLLSGNNGLHVLTADLATSGTTITVGGSSMTAEASPPSKAKLEVCGIRAAASDLAFTVSGSTATLTSSDIDFTTIGVKIGQYIHFGSPSTTGTVQNGLGTGTDNYGYARITAIAAGQLTLDKLDSTLATDASNSAAVDIMYGKFVRNVEVTADSDDERYLERSYSFEQLYPDGESVGTDTYEYARGNFANQMDVVLSLNSLATCTWGFIGTTAEAVTTSRDTGPSTAVDPVKTTAVGTASDLRLTTDVISSASDVCFKDVTMTILNNMSPENCLGTLGASFINSGLFEVNIEGQMLFTKKEITNAVRNNTTVTMTSFLTNDNGGIVWDMPSMTFGGGDKELPVDASVVVNITGQTFTDPTFGHDIGVSLFPAVPYA